MGMDIVYTYFSALIFLIIIFYRHLFFAYYWKVKRTSVPLQHQIAYYERSQYRISYLSHPERHRPFRRQMVPAGPVPSAQGRDPAFRPDIQGNERCIRKDVVGHPQKPGAGRPRAAQGLSGDTAACGVFPHAAWRIPDAPRGQPHRLGRGAFPGCYARKSIGLNKVGYERST